MTHAQDQKFERGRKRRGAARGETFYLGRSGSRRRLCVYDKAVESKGEIDAIRWELREQEEAAQAAFGMLWLWVKVHGSLEGYGKVVAERLVSFVDFREENGARVAEYEELVQGAARRKGYDLAKPAVEVGKVADWLRRQCGPSFAAVFEAVGEDVDFIAWWLNDGRERMRVRHSIVAGQPFDWRELSRAVRLERGDPPLP